MGAEGAASEPSPQLRAFQALLAQVEAAATAGLLGADVAAAAAELDFDLKRELIRAEAEIAVLRLEVAAFDGKAQQLAIDRLVAAVAGRESAVNERTRHLERVAGMSRCPDPVPTKAASSMAESGPEADPETPAEEAGQPMPTDRGRVLEMAFEAQDLIEDPDP
jgi:hypothetical protein